MAREVIHVRDSLTLAEDYKALNVSAASCYLHHYDGYICMYALHIYSLCNVQDGNILPASLVTCIDTKWPPKCYESHYTGDTTYIPQRSPLTGDSQLLLSCNSRGNGSFFLWGASHLSSWSPLSVISLVGS